MKLYLAMKQYLAKWLYPAIFQLGYSEGNGDIGMTYGSTESLRSIAYDVGRTKRRIDLGWES